MTTTTQLIGFVGGAATAVVLAFAIYRAIQRERVRRVRAWVKDYLFLNHQCDSPAELNINCSDDQLWPVIVRFIDPQSGFRYCLQFMCSGTPSTFRMISTASVSS
jgi:hypothetical protein